MKYVEGICNPVGARGVYCLNTPAIITPNNSITVPVWFKPASFGTFHYSLTITSTGGNAKIPLTGSSPTPVISLVNPSSSFTAKAGQSQLESIKVTDGSINPLVVDSAKTQTQYFKFSGKTFPDTVRQSDTASIAILFSPDSVRSYEDTLFIYSNATATSITVALSGTGSTPTGIMREGNAIPTVYELYQNYPNPFNPTTTIKFALPEQSQVTVTIYDVLGREVKELVNDKLQAGYYHFSWNASQFASGIYFCRIVAQSITGDRKDFVQVKKLVLIK